MFCQSLIADMSLMLASISFLARRSRGYKSRLNHICSPEVQPRGVVPKHCSLYLNFPAHEICNLRFPATGFEGQVSCQQVPHRHLQCLHCVLFYTGTEQDTSFEERDCGSRPALIRANNFISWYTSCPKRLAYKAREIML